MKAIFYRNFQYEKWYFLLYIFLFIACFFINFTVIFEKTVIFNQIYIMFIALVSVHCLNNAMYINKQSSQIFYMSLPISKVDTVKGHYLYNLILTIVSFLMVLIIAFIEQDTIYVQAGIFIVATNLLTISIGYRNHAQVSSDQLFIWLVCFIYGFIGLFYFSVYANRNFPFSNVLGWKIFLNFTPLIFMTIAVITWIIMFKKAINMAKSDKITIYGGVR